MRKEKEKKRREEIRWADSGRETRAKKKVLLEERVEIDSVRVEPCRNHCTRLPAECSMTEIYSVYRYTEAAEFTCLRSKVGGFGTTLQAHSVVVAP